MLSGVGISSIAGSSIEATAGSTALAAGGKSADSADGDDTAAGGLGIAVGTADKGDGSLIGELGN
ncbi:MAG: hypothetical protein AB8B99_12795 [Phormidesmis sp.]